MVSCIKEASPGRETSWGLSTEYRRVHVNCLVNAIHTIHFEVPEVVQLNLDTESTPFLPVFSATPIRLYVSPHEVRETNYTWGFKPKDLQQSHLYPLEQLTNDASPLAWYTVGSDLNPL